MLLYNISLLVVQVLLNTCQSVELLKHLVVIILSINLIRLKKKLQLASIQMMAESYQDPISGLMRHN